MRSLHLTEGHSKTQHDYQSTHNTDGSTNKTDDGESLSLIPSQSTTAKPAGLTGLKYAIILPTYTKHIPLAIEFFQSFMCLCTDYQEIDIHVIVSDSNEVTEFQNALNGLKSCGESFSIFQTPPANVNGPKPKFNIVNLFDILPPVFHTLTKGKITGADTSALISERNKYQYQTIKKLAAAMELKYDWALWLDSEAIAVQPFSIRQTFDSYIKNPTIFRSRMTNTDFMRAIIGSSANVLNRDIESFGQKFWNLESVEWIFEKAVIDDLVQYVENTHGQDFWTVWATRGSPFEISLYNMHVQARKLETTNPMFTKYQIIETETEMERFGIGAARAIMDTMTGTGMLERGYELFKVAEVVPGFSAVLKNFGQRLFRLDDLGIAPPESFHVTPHVLVNTLFW
ncbi:hypothetical protein CcaCcLH18_11026 [Colletotrichum camelliae]|nr:hypothetical protein CcaCcLH18_11026 [Colletotrichum camelliae]